MGSFHCIPEGCGRVIYQKYLPPVIRWRYPGEDWIEFIGHNYSYTFTEDCPVDYYLVEFWYDYYESGDLWQTNRYFRFPNLFYGKIINVQGNAFSGVYYTHVAVHYIDENGNQQIKRDFINTSPTSNYVVTDWKLVKPPDVECDCIFKVYQDGEIVHQSTRDVCPEVEQLPCRLDDVIKEIKIEKIPYLQRIEVRNQGIDYLPLPTPLLRPYPLPEECLNIYKTLVTAPPFLQDGVVLPDAFNIYQFVKQICSASGCPPPKYQVLCDCDCEKYPNGTCPVPCGNHICCYDTSTGKAVKEIPIDKYCGSKN